MRQSREETQTARGQTRAAEERAVKSELAQAQAAKEVEQAQVAKTLANQQALRAQQQAQNAREELDQIQKAREEELNRMQEALSKVAATRRTADGMVIDLGNDSFKFDFDRATLRPENRELLSRLAGILSFQTDIQAVCLRLHRRSWNGRIQSGSFRTAGASGPRLSRQIWDSTEMMTTKGFGKSSPRIKTPSPEAREKNRRVEIGIVDTAIKYTEEVR